MKKHRNIINGLVVVGAVLLVASTALFAQTAIRGKTLHHHCIIIGENLESTEAYQFVTPWGKCKISHEEWKTLDRVIRRIGANASADLPAVAGKVRQDVGNSGGGK